MTQVFPKFIGVLFIVFSAYSACPQTGSAKELHFEIKRNYPPLSISKEKLKNAQSLEDINERYDTDWVKEYLSVEIKSSRNGVQMNSISKDNILSQQQKKIMAMADPGTDIYVKVNYVPQNNLSENVSKEMKFSFIVDPEREAGYTEGSNSLLKFLKENAIDRIPENTFEGYGLAAIIFTINEKGQIINPRVIESSKDETVDAILMETITKMPAWTPAEYDNGFKISQEFVLLVGNTENCMIHTLNLK